MPMTNEKELEIRSKLIKLLKPQIEDEEFFCKEFFFHRPILGNSELENLIDSEMEQYTEKGTLRLAEILFELSKAPPSTSYTPDGGKIHFTFKVHRYTCLCLYERAAQNDSAEGCYKASQMYFNGGCGIPKDIDKAREYSTKASKLGYIVKEEPIPKLISANFMSTYMTTRKSKKSFWERLFGKKDKKQ